MHISANSIHAAASVVPTGSDLAWFAARQPAVVRFLTHRVHGDDAFATAITAAWTITSAYATDEQIPAPRLDHQSLDHAVTSVAREVCNQAVVDGLAHRQPHLASFVGELASDPPLPLSGGERTAVYESLLAIAYALDERVTGRPL